MANEPIDNLPQILEAALLASSQPLSLARMATLFEGPPPSASQLNKALTNLQQACDGRGVELVEVASGWRYQVRSSMQPWIGRLWEERQARYSRALLETLALIAYRQPVTRGEIEEVRGVTVSTRIVRTLEEREWIRVVGFRDVPGKPALYGTTKTFLDYFQLRSLDDLPALAEVRDMENFNPQLELEPADASIPAHAALADQSVDAAEPACNDQPAPETETQADQGEATP